MFDQTYAIIIISENFVNDDVTYPGIFFMAILAKSYQNIDKHDTDGLPHYNNAMTSALLDEFYALGALVMASL